MSTIHSPFADGAFEFGVAGFMICILPDAKCVSTDMARALRP